MATLTCRQDEEGGGKDTKLSSEIRMDAAALNAFLARAFPERGEGMARVSKVEPGRAWLALEPATANLRPGGIVSGPTLMGLADTAAYAVILAHIGEVPMAVTSSLTYHFLRGCDFATVHAEASLLKLGRRLATVDVRIWTKDPARPVGQASVVYALP